MSSLTLISYFCSIHSRNIFTDTNADAAINFLILQLTSKTKTPLITTTIIIIITTIIITIIIIIIIFIIIENICQYHEANYNSNIATYII
jgi:hypothetical protein